MADMVMIPMEWKSLKIEPLPGERQREFGAKEELLPNILAHEDCPGNAYTRLPRSKARLEGRSRLAGSWCGAQDLNLHGLTATGS